MNCTLLKALLASTALLTGLAHALPAPNSEQLAALKTMEGKKVRICIFDPIGANGPAVGYAKDYMLEAKKWGVNADIKAYTDERVAAEDLKAGQCDAAAITTLRAKQFNKFVGSLDAVGGIPDNAHMDMVLKTLSSPRMAPLMRNGHYEVVGNIPLGAAFVMVNDRAINSIEKAAGKKVAVMEWDKSQAKMVQRMGAQPVASDVINFVGKFNNGQVDIIAAPGIAFRPLELHRGLGTKGAIVNMPFMQITAVMVIRHEKFKPGDGQRLRSVVASRLDNSFALIKRSEADIPSQYWSRVPQVEIDDYFRLMREARVAMTQDGEYDPDMMRFLKRVRCRYEPANAECILDDE